MALAVALLCLMAFAGHSQAGLVVARRADASPPPPNVLAGASGRKLILSKTAGGGGGYTGKPELDFSTEDVQRSTFQASDFLLDFAHVLEDVNHRPALATLPNGGIAQALVTLEACAVSLPHTHPRGTEVAFVTKGEIFVGFIEENFSAATMTGGRFLGSTIPEGDSFVFPQGLLHFVINRSCNQSQFVASFPTRDPGTQSALASLFNDAVPMDVLRATTGLSDDDITIVKEKVKAIPDPSQDRECLKRCFGHY